MDRSTLRASLVHVARTLIAWGIALAIVVSSTAAFAQVRRRPPDPQTEHLRAAQSAERQGEWDTALAEYQTAHNIGPNLATFEGIARCQYELGHTIEAFDAYTVLSSMLGEPALTRAKVRERLAELSARIGLLVLTVKVPDAEVALDGQTAGKSPLLTTRRLRAGKHKVTVTKPGSDPTEQEVLVVGGVTTAVTIDDTKPAAAAPPTPTPENGEKKAPAAPEPATVVQPTPPPSEGEAWEQPHGTKSYHAVRTSVRPVIDGNLDDAIWQQAPKEDRFISIRSKPYGQPTTEPTSVQVAYDEENLYVAFRCAYAKKRERDDSFSSDELAVLTEAESVGVLVDPLHSHTNAFLFAVSRVGARADVELSEGGSSANENWRGIWNVATRRTEDTWTAEFKIPWGTMRMQSATGPITVGLNFRRREPVSGEKSLWTAQPPATALYDTNFFGHLEGLVDIRPDQRLYLQPYIAVAYDQTPPVSQSILTDMTGQSERVRGFAGLYARYQPPGPFRFDGTFNPNFVGVNPDQALANFDRFELEFPEARPFFAEDTQRFQFGGRRYDFGDLGAQLFYSRRIGLRTNAAGLTEVVPILYGGKSVLRSGGSEAAVMNVGLSPNRPKVTMNDNVSVGRFSQTFAEGRRVGAIVLGRTGDSGGDYIAGGADGTLTLFDRHLFLNGFVAQTASTAAKRSGAAQVSLDWSSQDFYASAAYVDVGKAFDAQLGYFPLTGVRSEILAAGYTPVIRNDLVQQVLLESQLTLARDRGDQRIFDRGAVSASAVTIEQAVIQAQLLPAIEQVAQDFPLANGRVNVLAGRYDQLGYSINATTAPRRTVVGGLGYLGGDLFAGRRRAPSASLGLNLGRFTTTVLYRLFLVNYGTDSIEGHQISARAGYSYTPLAKSTLVVETNTFASRGLAQFITSYTFGELSTIALVVRGTSGSTLQERAADWNDRPNVSAVLSFAYGITPF
jgi:hypothetical protein